ncbi:MAG: ThiF family adenylyltransferase, partial [Planctomycetota bacterium]
AWNSSNCCSPAPGSAPSCAEAGVLGVLPGVVGLLMAIETIKTIVGIGETLVGRLLTYDALAVEFRSLRIRRDINCRICAGEFPGYAPVTSPCSP